MKKSLLALAALTAFAGAASAQSSVTLFGIVDLSARQLKNSGGTQQQLAQDGIASSRLGFRGIEDLGGGLRAGFWLEGAINPDTGTAGGQSWQRRSTLSLMGGFGEIRMGRDYTPSFWNHTVFDPFGTNGIGSTLNITNANLGSLSTTAAGGTAATNGTLATTFVRANNSIGYFLPAMGGLYGQVMFAAGEGVTGNKYTGARLGYAAGPLNVAVASGKTAKTGTMPSTFKDTNFGISFNAGFATFIAQAAKTSGDVNGTAAGSDSQKTMLLGVTAPLGSGTLKASFTKASGTTTNAAVDQFNAKQIAVGYVYDLSKRTAVYGTFSNLSNGGSSTTGANFVVGGGGASQARGAKSSGLEFGVRHSF
jgi:predicted porin